MPWEHCGRTLLDDGGACPACGATKDQWTVGFEVTRTFTVRARPVVKLLLLDGQDAPVAGAAFTATLEDGAVVEGRLDDLGAASVPLPAPGACVVRFPGRRVTRLPDEGEAAPSGDAAADAPDGGLRCAARARRHRLRLAGARLALRLRDPAGAALGGARYQLAFEGQDAPREGTADAEGRLDEPVPEGCAAANLKVWRGGVVALRARVRLGALPPADDLAGGKARLALLGYHPGPLDGPLDERARAALRAFQRKRGLSPTGEYDAATRDALRAAAAGGAARG